MSLEVKNFIFRCLDKQKETRLGTKGDDEILNHPWFKDLIENGKPSMTKLSYFQTKAALKPTGLTGLEF